MDLFWWIMACLIWATQGPILYAEPIPSPRLALPRHFSALPPRCQPSSFMHNLVPSSLPLSQHLAPSPSRHPPVPSQPRPSIPSPTSHVPSQPSSGQQKPPKPPRKSPQSPPEKESKLAVIVGGVLGSLVVLILIAIFVVLVIKLAWKRHGHIPPGPPAEGRGHHNRDATYAYKEPSPYECPARQPHGHEYAELEGQDPYGNSTRQPQSSVHLYEEADKYFRGVNDEDCANPGYQLNIKGVNGKRPLFQCIISTPPPEDDYANPADAVTNDNIQESGIVDECQTKVGEQHNYAVLEQDMGGNGTGNDKGMEKEGYTTEISDSSLPQSSTSD